MSENRKYKKTQRYQACNNKQKKNCLVSESKYHTTKWFSQNSLTIEMKKIKVKINKPVYVGLKQIRN